MKRRDFLKKSTVAVGLASTLESLPALAANESPSAAPFPAPSPTTSPTNAAQADNRSVEYLRRARGDSFLPKPPLPARPSQVSPMPLAERVRRKIVPQRGFCSTAPASLVSESLTTGNGAMNVELMGDPYSEQIIFHHEDLLIPWTRPTEAPKVADIFPQVRQLVMAGKHREAMALAVERMNESPIKQNTEPHRIIPAFVMQLDFPKPHRPRTICALSTSRTVK